MAQIIKDQDQDQDQAQAQAQAARDAAALACTAEHAALIAAALGGGRSGDQWPEIFELTPGGSLIVQRPATMDNPTTGVTRVINGFRKRNPTDTRRWVAIDANNGKVLVHRVK